MPASPIGSDTAALIVIWMAALALCAMSMVALIVVVIRRAILQKRTRWAEARRMELKRCCHAVLNSSIQFTPASLPQVTPLHFPLIMRITLDILRSLKGDDVLRIVELVQMWGMEPYLHTTAWRGSRGRRIQALSLLSHFTDPASYAILKAHARYPDMYVQIAALRGLGMRAHPDEINDIVQDVIHSTHDMKNSLMLADILHRFGTAAVPSLIELVTSNASIEVRCAGLMALGSIGSEDALDTLIAISEGDEIELCTKSIAAMGAIGRERAAYAVAAHLESADARIRIQAAQALGKIKVMGTLPDLSIRLADEDWWVRFRAAEAVYQFGDVGIAALRSMGRQNNEAGLIARQVLGELAGFT
jgi:hypothetical protein